MNEGSVQVLLDQGGAEVELEEEEAQGGVVAGSLVVKGPEEERAGPDHR